MGVTFSLATGLLGALTLLRRVKEKEEETSPPQGVDPLRFETAVRSLLQAKNFRPEHASFGPYDFEFKTAKGLYLVELKTSLRATPRTGVRRLFKMLEESLERGGALAGLVVTAEPVPHSLRTAEHDRIHVMDLNGLHRFLGDA